jgi:acetyltransferase-like isoleucine patch superfamily enzyme
MLRNIFNRLLLTITYIAPGGSTLRVWLHRLRGVKIGKNVWISEFVYLDKLHPEAIEIEDNVTIGLRTSVITHMYWGRRRKGQFNRVIIEKDVYIGPHCLILPNVRIGKGSVIKGGTAVSHNVPAAVLYGSDSARPLGRVTVPLTNQHSYEEFVKGLAPIRKKDGGY